MASLGYDAQSLQLDGRRLWLVSTSIAFDRIPASRWRATLIQARLAGFNCIDVRLAWALHEPKAGRFHFTGQADVRQFIQIAIELGLWCIVRPGPCAREDWPAYGLPGWLLQNPALRMRQADPQWLEACARYLGNVMDQIRDLQATAPAASASRESPTPFDAGLHTAGGIVMIQAEDQWLCHHPEQGQTYLGQLVSYLRQNGCEVPITCSNNLWQTAEGTFHTWRADQHLAADLRQLAMVQPLAPRMLSDLPAHPADDTLARQLASVVGTGGQFNLTALDEHWLNPHQSSDTSAGMQALRPLLHFASQFGYVLAHAMPTGQQSAISPDSPQPGFAVFQQQGPQGKIVLLIRTDPSDQTTQAPLLLPDGQTLTIPMGDDPIAWMGMDINLTGVAALTLTNLRPCYWLHRQMLVLAGPAGSDGLVSINDSPMSIPVPGPEQKPAVVMHEGITVVVLNASQIQQASPCAAGLAIGVRTLNEAFEPVADEASAEPVVIHLQGRMTKVRPSSSTSSASAMPTLKSWQVADALSWQKAKAGQLLEGPASLESFHAGLPWGWYHLALETPASRSVTLACPSTDSSLLLYVRGKHRFTLEAGQIGKTTLARELAVFAASPLRPTDDWKQPLPGGLAGDLLMLKPAALSTPKMQPQGIVDPLSFTGYLHHYRQRSRPMNVVYHWDVKARKNTAYVLHLTDLPARAVVMLNEAIIHITENARQQSSSFCVLDESAGLQTGKNLLQLAWLDDDAQDTPSWPTAIQMNKRVKLYEAASLTAEAKITYLPWSLPPTAAWKSKLPAGAAGPCWHRCQFKAQAGSSPLNLLTTGLSQGCVYLNDQLLGLYDNTARPDQPGQRIALPDDAFIEGQTQQLIIFDSQSSSPDQCSLERLL